MDEKVKVGLIGCGTMGRIYMKALSRIPNAKIAGVSDKDNEKMQQAVHDFDIPQSYVDAYSLIRDPNIDAVVFALPPGLRYEMVLAAFRESKHVLLEKPAALDKGEVSSFIAKQGSLIVGCCSSRLRFSPVYDAVFKLLQSGQLGKLRSFRSRWIIPGMWTGQTPPPAWRLSKSLNGGGITINLGMYILDFMLGATDWQVVPKTILAHTWKAESPSANFVPEWDGEAHATALILCEEGETLSIEQAEQTTSDRAEDWEISGTKGSVTFHLLPNEKCKVTLIQKKSHEMVSETVWEGKVTFEELQFGLISDFIDAIVNKRQPKTGLKQAYLLQSITDAIYTSSALGKSVDV